MKRQILQKLQIKDLQHYHTTLLKRVQQLKQFNNELAKDNAEIVSKMNAAKTELYAKPKEKEKKKVNKNNFQFDDLYKMGKEKVGKYASFVNVGGVKSLFNAGGQKIKQGFGFAKSYIVKGNNNKQQTNASKKIQDLENALNQQQPVNQNADFNSYDLGDHRHLKNYEAKAEQHLQVQSPKEQARNSKDEEPVKKEKPTAPRRKIFDREYQQRMLAEKKYKKQQEQSEEQSSSGYESPTRTTTKQENTEHPKQQQQVHATVNPITITSTTSPKNNKTKTNPTPSQSQPQSNKKRELKQVQVEPNKIVDLEGDNDSNEDNEYHEIKNNEKQQQKQQIVLPKQYSSPQKNSQSKTEETAKDVKQKQKQSHESHESHESVTKEQTQHNSK